ncbi:hypothetical protein HY411_00640 [Candidatus Gottesmanbacteria bacterium]|nr:hypothetical protein [Candidatus Gottesmanbacteria bacterium]
MKSPVSNLVSGLRGLTKRLRSHAVPLVILFLLWLAVTLVNMPKTGQWLTGWDNLHPEFNVFLNFKRAIFGVWQEFQGLGLVGGHGYSATLLHTLFVALLSLILPVTMVRAAVIFLMLLVGSIGTYALAVSFLTRIHEAKPYHRWAALVAGAFTMLNLATIQNFYIPLEAFVIMFGILPWLMLSLWRLLDHQSKTAWLLFLLVNVAIAPVGFIPPLFVIIMLCVGMTILTWFLMQPNRSRLILSIKIVIGIACIHAFWLIPVAYFSATHQSVYLAAYNNLSSTEHFIHMNQKYGTLAHLPIMRSFLFESLDVSDAGGTTPIFSPWIAHLANPWIAAIGYGFFGLALLGWITAVARARKSYNAFSVAILEFILFILLATDVPPFSWISLLLQKVSPTFFQSFRIAFTKVSLAYALMISLLIGLGLEQLFRWVKRSAWQTIGTGITILLLIIFSFPSFRGHFLYERTKQAVPPAYLNLFTFFKQPSTQGRILNLPQGWNWGWTPYAWGYSGSGFLWYGIENPIMDRAFDVWSAQNENYYWELVYALYSKQYNLFEMLIRKYDVEWVLFDPSVVPYQQPRAIFSTLDMESYLNSSSRLELFKTFDHLKLYRVTTKPSESFVSLEPHLPNILPLYEWTENDAAYQKYGPYISNPTTPPDVWYPFRTLFTKRRTEEGEFTIEKTSDSYIIASKATPPPDQQFFLQAPAYRDVEPYIPGLVSIKRVSGRLSIQPLALYPTLTETTTNIPLASPTSISLPHTVRTINLFINGERINTIAVPARDGMEQLIKTTFLTKRPNVIDVVDDRDKIVQTIRAFVPPDPPSAYEFPQPVRVTIPITGDQQSYDSNTDETFYKHQSHDCIKPSASLQKEDSDETGRFLVFSSDSERKQCFDIILPKITQSNGYLVEVQTKNVTGKSLIFVVINSQTRKNDMEVALPKTKAETTSFFIIPPMQTDGLGYALKFLNEAEYGEPATNYLRSVRVTPIPYQWLTQLIMTAGKPSLPTQPQGRALSVETLSVEKVEHPNPGYYKIAISEKREAISKNQNTALVLSQAFDPGWKAWIVNAKCQMLNAKCSWTERFSDWIRQTLPFLFGAEVKDHVLVNNWSNGWMLQSNELTNNEQTIMLFFLPQLLQWLGLVLLPLPFLWMWYDEKSR